MDDRLIKFISKTKKEIFENGVLVEWNKNQNYLKDINIIIL